MSEELDDLRGLLHHPGFLRLCAYQQKVWGELSWVPLVRSAIGQSAEVALVQLRRLMAERDATERLLRWPEQHVKDLEAMTTNPHLTPGVRV